MKVSVSQTISVPFSVIVSNIYLSFNKKFRSFVPLEFLSKNHIEVLILSIVVTLITYHTQSLHSVHGLLLTHVHCFEFVSISDSQVMHHITAHSARRSFSLHRWFGVGTAPFKILR